MYVDLKIPHDFGQGVTNDTFNVGCSRNAEGIKLNMILIELIVLLKKKSYQFYVTSCFRTKSCNSKAGGAPNSRHLYGDAVDIGLGGQMSLDQFMKAFKDQDVVDFIYKEGINEIIVYSDHHIHFGIDPSQSGMYIKFPKSSDVSAFNVLYAKAKSLGHMMLIGVLSLGLVLITALSIMIGGKPQFPKLGKNLKD